jgi:hypothetical protein
LGKKSRDRDVSPTIEDSYKIDSLIDYQKCTLKITDIAGGEDFEYPRETWIGSNERFVPVYSILSESSTCIQRLYEQIQ